MEEGPGMRMNSKSHSEKRRPVRQPSQKPDGRQKRLRTGSQWGWYGIVIYEYISSYKEL
jgi:hypothetical protein